MGVFSSHLHIWQTPHTKLSPVYSEFPNCLQKRAYLNLSPSLSFSFFLSDLYFLKQGFMWPSLDSHSLHSQG